MSLKDLIIEASYQLFADKGYEKTTVAEIIQKAGTSKGGFYHHFKSKDEILETITLSYVKDVQVYYNEILEHDSLSIIEKFTETFYGICRMKMAFISEWPKMNRMYTFTGNHVLLKKMADEFYKVTTDFYRQLIKKGNLKNVFSANYTDELAELWAREVIEFHRKAKRLFFKHSEEDLIRFNRSLEFNQQLINHLLGLEQGTIELVSLGKNYVHMIREQISKEVKLNDKMV